MIRGPILTVTLNPALDLTLSVEAFQADNDYLSDGMQQSAGGKGFNCSRALKQLKVSTKATGFLGGWTGQRVEYLLTADGIDCEFFPIQQETRMNWTVIDRKEKTMTRVLQEGPRVDRAEWQSMASGIGRLFAKARWVVFCGRNAKGLPVKAYAELAALAKKHGVKTVLDIHGRELRQALQVSPDLIKPNIDEAEQALGRKIRTKNEAMKAVLAFLKRGAKHVILSRDVDGAMVSDGSMIWNIRPPRARFVNDVGCGDVLLAGCLWALTQKEKFVDAAAWGVAAATASIDHLQPGKIHLGQMNKVRRKLRIENILI